MKERPILFSGAMVRAMLAGTKTQTRRMVKPSVKGCGVGVYTHGPGLVVPCNTKADGDPWTDIACPYGSPGDRLWVRETWAYNGQGSINTGPKNKRREGYVTYAADGAKMKHYFEAGPALRCPGQHLPKQREDEDEWEFADRKARYFTEYFKRMRPSIHMPRWASRITLEVTDVRCERLQEITEADAKAEGIERVASGLWRDYLSDRTSHHRAVDSYRTLWESINGAGSWSTNPWVWVVSFSRRRAP